MLTSTQSEVQLILMNTTNSFHVLLTNDDGHQESGRLEGIEWPST